jgi:hydroxymethylglutaryl-CoA synthase
MIGISSYGIYLPLYRISRQAIFSAMGWFAPTVMPGEKAVANYDEDSITMAVAASMNCLKGVNPEVDGLFFATTTAPYSERESAAIIATALDLKPSIRTSDFANSLKAGTGAIISAYDSIKSGGAENILVCSSDCRLGKPASSQEIISGDAAAAFLMGSTGVIAGLQGFYCMSYDFPGNWRAVSDKFVRTMEDRWIRDEGYTKFIPEAIVGLLKKYGLEAKDFAKVVYPCFLSARDHTALGKRLGFRPDQIQAPLLTEIGETGSASPLLMLIAALEDARPGDNILVASYGNGSEALFFRVTEEIEKRGERTQLRNYLSTKKELTNYQKYLVFRGIIPVETGSRGEVGPTQLPVTWRDRRAILGLCGSRCKSCGTPQYPPQRVCVNPNCGAIDKMEVYRFSDMKGTLFSYTEDRLAFSISPPQITGTIDFEGGGRFTFDMTDCEAGSLNLGMPIVMTLRKKYFDEAHGIYGYFWKAAPHNKK